MMKLQAFLNRTKMINEIEKVGSDCFVLNSYHIELFKVIDEKTAQQVDNKVLDTAIKYLMKKFDVTADELKYIGYTDLGFMKKGSKLLQFNILKKGHPKFGSTVAYKYEG